MCVCGYMVILNQLKYLHLISVKRPVFCVLSDGHRELKPCGGIVDLSKRERERERDDAAACVNGAASAIMELISEQSAHNCR
jgi:hypothetical protein